VIVQPRLVVGADGRGSRVREAMGYAAETHDYESPLVILFGPRLAPDPANEIKTFMGPNGTLSRIPRTGGGWKVGTTIAKSEIAFWKTATLRMRQAAIAKLAPELEGFAAALAGFYPVRLLNATQWTRGNTVLLGDACHAMHPARGQGMNMAIRCIARLVDLLPEPAEMANAEILQKRLRAYESGTKPAVEKVLADNHARGETMDARDPAVIETSIRAMRKIAEDPELLRRYRMQSAGYADALSSLSG
jgi:2-polyprenyl-6-methoxyphenol hydroxylase-like FAD-dependent oxidoreductase